MEPKKQQVSASGAKQATREQRNDRDLSQEHIFLNIKSGAENQAGAYLTAKMACWVHLAHAKLWGCSDIF